LIFSPVYAIRLLSPVDFLSSSCLHVLLPVI